MLYSNAMAKLNVIFQLKQLPPQKKNFQRSFILLFLYVALFWLTYRCFNVSSVIQR